MIHFIFFISVALLIAFIIKNVLNLLFSFGDYSIHKKRLQQLRREVDKKESNSVEVIEKYTDPVIKNLFPLIERYLPSLRFSNMDGLKKDLRMAKWDDVFTPETFVASSIILKIVGAFVFMFAFILPGIFKVVAMAWAAALMFGLDQMFKNELKSKKDRLFNDFPDFIRITSGYLSADMPLVQSVTDAIKYVGPDWKPILQQFVVDCDTKNIDTALNNLKENADLFEVKEFVSLVRLTLEQGGNAKEGFHLQAEKITEMQKNLMIIKVGKRKTMSQVIQGPLLLCNMAILALPTVGEVITTL